MKKHITFTLLAGILLACKPAQPAKTENTTQAYSTSQSLSTITPEDFLCNNIAADSFQLSQHQAGRFAAKIPLLEFTLGITRNAANKLSFFRVENNPPFCSSLYSEQLPFTPERAWIIPFSNSETGWICLEGHANVRGNRISRCYQIKNNGNFLQNADFYNLAPIPAKNAFTTGKIMARCDIQITELIQISDSVRILETLQFNPNCSQDSAILMLHYTDPAQGNMTLPFSGTGGLIYKMYREFYSAEAE